MPNISSVIKAIQDIMRKDTGVDGDAQRLSQIVWMLFLKILPTVCVHMAREKYKRFTLNLRLLHLG